MATYRLRGSTAGENQVVGFLPNLNPCCVWYDEYSEYISGNTLPLLISLSTFSLQTSDSESSIYELYSVVIHGGSTHGGHYHAYIRDVDELGVWTKPVSFLLSFVT